jgi:hypothetical protein
VKRAGKLLGQRKNIAALLFKNESPKEMVSGVVTVAATFLRTNKAWLLSD